MVSRGNRNAPEARFRLWVLDIPVDNAFIISPAGLGVLNPDMIGENVTMLDRSNLPDPKAGEIDQQQRKVFLINIVHQIVDQLFRFLNG